MRLWAMRLSLLSLMPMLLLLGCAVAPREAAELGTRQLAAATSGPLRPYPETGKFLQCLPFARAVSGIALYGDAWPWWDAAARQHFSRGRAPEVGAVLVLR